MTKGLDNRYNISVNEEIVDDLKKSFGEERVKIQPAKVKFDTRRRYSV